MAYYKLLLVLFLGSMLWFMASCSSGNDEVVNDSNSDAMEIEKVGTSNDVVVIGDATLTEDDIEMDRSDKIVVADSKMNREEGLDSSYTEAELETENEEPAIDNTYKALTLEDTDKANGSLVADSNMFRSLFDGSLGKKPIVSMASINDLLIDNNRLKKLLSTYKVKEKKLDINMKLDLMLQMMLLDVMLATDASAALDSICTLTNLRALDLRGYAIEKLPNCFSKLKNLEVLILDDNKLDEFPMQLLELKNLKYLAYRGNGLTGLPTDIYKLDQLEYLLIGENQITQLPSSISALKKLVGLDIRKNPFNGHSSLELVCAFESLVSLSMSRTGLKEVPACIAQLSKLEILNINDNVLRSLPQQVGELDKLRTISFDNELMDYDQAFGVLSNCDSLEKITFIKANIDSIPLSIAGLRSLRSLRFFDCGLKYIPKEIGQLHNLTYLGVSNNYLGYLEPAIFDLVNLESLSIATNSLDSVPADVAKLTQLKRLMVKDNYLTDEQVDELKKLLPDCNVVY